MRPTNLHLKLGISSHVSTTLSALLTRPLILFGLFPNSHQYSLGPAQMVFKSLQLHLHDLAHRWAFYVHFPASACVFCIKMKNQRRRRKILNHQTFFSQLCSIQPYDLQKNSNWCDSLFKRLRKKSRRSSSHNVTKRTGTQRSATKDQRHGSDHRRQT